MLIRPAAPADAAALARIWNQGIEDRIATFETAPKTEEQLLELLGHPLLVAEADGAVVGFALAAPYSARACYSGIGEVSIYVDRQWRGKRAGAALLAALSDSCAARGFWKLTGKLLVGNEASRALVLRGGFREVGVHLRHGKLDGEWRDVLVVEKLL